MNDNDTPVIATGAIPPPAAMTKAWLLTRFGESDSPGWSPIVTDEDDEEQVFSRTGDPAAMCWASANEVIAELGDDRAVRTGYFCTPGSAAHIAAHAEGHDLALVDGRFLVDGWLAHVVCDGPCVLDLRDAADLARACLIHEPFATWTIVPAAIDGIKRAA